MTKLYNFLVKDGDALAVAVSVILFVIFGLSVYFGSSAGGYSLSELTTREDLSDVNCFNPGLWMVYILTFLAVVFMLVGIIRDLFINVKSGESKSIYGFIAVFVIFIILYFTSSHDTNGRYAAYWSNPEFHINEGISKFISAGLYTLGILTLVAFLLILYYEVKAFFR